MTRPSPATALNGVQVGHICDRYNVGIRTGDKAVAYATYYNADGWVVRRVICDCGTRTIGLPPTVPTRWSSKSCTGPGGWSI
jgi:hypothetical protein